MTPASRVPATPSEDLGRHLVGPDGVVQRVRPGAYAWCERDGAVLLVRVAPRGLGAGTWTLPGGGLRFGEEPSAAAVREVREETGCEVSLGPLLGVRSAVVEPGETQSGHRVQTIAIVYRGEIAGRELVVEQDGSSDLAAWIPFRDLDALPLAGLAAWARTLVGR